ncbi:MAG: hypothetical protein JWM11_6990 [Planctomycetaceae bacterium]|nr:hypothetical protein [Planctomycetaceae bacterium]
MREHRENKERGDCMRTGSSEGDAALAGLPEAQPFASRSQFSPLKAGGLLKIRRT